MVELTILRETTSNKTASIFLNSKYSASGACKQKIGMFYWINNFYISLSETYGEQED